MVAQTVTVALVAMCVVLTVAFLASLRGIAELRLRLAGQGGLDPATRLVIGRRLPDSLIAVIPDPARDTIVAFLSGTCGSCLGVASELSRTQADQVVAFVAGTDTDDIIAALPPGVAVVHGPPTERILADLPIDTWPTAILQRDGYIVAVGQGRGADQAADLDSLWRLRASTSQEAHT